MCDHTFADGVAAWGTLQKKNDPGEFMIYFRKSMNSLNINN